MGLAGTFIVQADGAGDQYQWSLNGIPIPGATSATYTTPPTAFSDTGETFTVTITNSSGSIASSPATLTVTARAPKAGDLRFQQVDAESTINGYALAPARAGTYVFCPALGAAGISQSFGDATGTGFFLVNNQCVEGFSPFTVPAGVTGLEVAYSGISTENYLSELNASPSTSGFPGPNDPGTVITSLNLLPAYNSAEFAYIQSSMASRFNRAQYVVPASGLQAVASQEGLSGRVLTAISYDGALATFFDYGWTGDPSTVYEAEVVFATLDTVTAQAQALAESGYIITATGTTQAADGSGVILIGTRVQGDTMPRPFLIGDALAGSEYAVFAQGYAVVAVVDKYANGVPVIQNFLGER